MSLTRCLSESSSLENEQLSDEKHDTSQRLQVVTTEVMIWLLPNVESGEVVDAAFAVVVLCPTACHGVMLTTEIDVFTDLKSRLCW